MGSPLFCHFQGFFYIAFSDQLGLRSKIFLARADFLGTSNQFFLYSTTGVMQTRLSIAMDATRNWEDRIQG